MDRRPLGGGSPDLGFPLPPITGAPLLNRPAQHQMYGQTFDRLPPIHQMPPADMAAAHMFGTDPSAYLDDPNDAKRRRIARACDMCRKKKIKCDGKMPSCTHCVNYKTTCVFTQVEKKRQPPKGAKYIEGLENRLVRMESLLRLSGLLGDDDDDDLGELERKLAVKMQAASRRDSQGASNPASPSPPASAGEASTPRSSVPSPPPSKEREGVPGTSETPLGPGLARNGGPASEAPARKASVAPQDKADRADRADEAKKEDESEGLNDMMCSLVTNTYGETRYIGSSSGFSIFSPKGMQWVNERTGDNSFQQMISHVSMDDNKWVNWKPEVFADLFRRPVFRPLPSKPEALSLLNDYFENFNCMFPLFHRPTFMHLVERQYSDDPYEGAGWWASLNVALAVAHRLRVMSNLVPAEEDEKAWAHLKNALAVFSELTMRNTDLLSVQALLGMALFMQGTPNPQPTFLLLANAIRLSHTIGLHKRGTGFNLNPIEIEQRKRVFWIAYILDKDLCLRAGRPPIQDDGDMNVELPDADPADNIGNIPLADNKGKMNLFRVMCEFATIESKVYRRLYATSATKQTVGELLQTIGELDAELDAWKDGIPIDFRPEHEIKASHTPLILHIVMLHFAYYNCLTTIHRMSVHHGYWTSRLSNYAIQGLNAKPLNPRVYASAALCVSSARASISMLKYIPQGDFSCVWLILYFPVSSLVTLFGHVLQNPLDARARSDTRLMNLVVTFLSMLGQEAESGGVHRMLGVCSEFERIAKVVIDRAEKEHASRRKRKNQEAHEAPPVPAEADADAEVKAEAGADKDDEDRMNGNGTNGTGKDGTGKEGTPGSGMGQTPRPTSSCSSYRNTPAATPAEAQAAAVTAAEIVNSHKAPSRRTNSVPHHSHHTTASLGSLGSLGKGSLSNLSALGGRSSGRTMSVANVSAVAAQAGLYASSSPLQVPSAATNQTPSPAMAAAGWPGASQGQGQQQPAQMDPPQPPQPLFGGDLDFSAFHDFTGFGQIPTELPMPGTLGQGQGQGQGQGLDLQSPGTLDLSNQPFLPIDLFSLPMTLDWDWAEMSGGAYPTVENGNFGL